MFAKNKGQQQQPQLPSDIQAKEKLAHYVYEYLMHLGAKQSAQTFLQEVSKSLSSWNVRNKCAHPFIVMFMNHF